MSNATDELRDARRALRELATSVSMMADKLTEAHAAVAARNIGMATELLRNASDYVDEMHGYLAIARDAHRALEKVAA
jgi:hypothetical protein